MENKAKGVKKSHFKLLKPLYEGLRKGTHMSLMVNFFEMIRRLILLYVAMFLIDKAWIQVIIFMTLSLMSLLYSSHSCPYYMPL